MDQPIPNPTTAPQPISNNPIPVPAAPPADGGPYVPAPVLTGYAPLPVTLPVTMQADTSTKLQGIADYHPAITSGPAFRSNFDDWFNTSIQHKVPQVSLKDALFSADPKIRAAATAAIQPNNTFDKLDVGTSTRSDYDSAAKYLNKEFGYTALTDNENMYAQYKNSGISGFAENAGKFLTRTVGSAILKLGQGVSGMLAMPLAAVQDGNFWSNVSDNALVNWFNKAEKTYKDQWFPVYQDAAARNMGFFERMVKDNTFWTSDFSDGLGFMLSAMLPATAWSKIGIASRLGEAFELTNYAKLGLLQKPLQALTRMATGESALTARGADMLISTINSTASEAFFEAKGVHDGVVQKYSDLSKINPDQLVTLPDGSHRTARNLSKQDIEDIAAHGAKNDFAANFPILMFSNAWETNLLYRGLGKAAASPISKGLSIGEDLLAQVEKPSSRLGKLWNGRLGFYTKKSVEATWWEGLWEENAQLAAQRLNDDSTEYDHSQNSGLSFFQQLYKQTRNAFTGKDPEAATSIGMGALTGILAGNLLTAAGKGYSKEKQIAAQTVAQLNNLRSSFLTGDIYQKAPDGSYVHNAQGQLVLDQNKLNAAALQSNSFADKAKRQEDFNSPDLRSLEQQQSFAQYFHAALQAGKGDQVIERLQAMGHKDPEAIVSLGFDPLQPKASPVALAELARSLKDIHADSQSLTLTSLPRGMSGEVATTINQSRRQEYYNRSAKSLIFGNLADQKTTELVEQQSKMTNEQNASLTDQLVTNHNLLQLRIAHNDDLIQDEHTDETTRKNLQEINTTLEGQLADIDKNDSIKAVPKDSLGYRQYEKPELNKRLVAKKFINLLNDVASMRNMQDAHALEATKIADPKKGFPYYFDSIAKQGEQLAAKASKQVPATPAPVPPPTTTPTTPVATTPVAPAPVAATPAQAAAQQTQQPVNAVDPPTPSIEPLSEEPPPFVPADETPVEEDLPSGESPAETGAPAAKEAPLSQSQEQVEQDNATHLQDIAQQVNEEHREEGKMIVNAFSVASKAVEFDKDTGIVIRDDKGRPVFNPYQRSLIDNGTLVPGTTIHLKYDDAATKFNFRPDGTEKPSHERYSEQGMFESNSENAYIRIYLKDKSGETTLGYVHNISGARRLLTQNVDIEQELKKLTVLRETVLANPDTEYEATVSKTGFGFANKGDNRSYQTISEAVKEDARPILAVKKGNVFVGEKGTQIGTRFGNKIREGATVLLLPNNVNGTEVMIPVYVNKRALATDPAISQVVSAALSNYLTSGDPAALNPARRYAYITDSAAVAISLTNNGLFLNPNGELIFRGKNITTLTMEDLMKQLLININTSDLNNASYIKQLRNSPAIQTSFFAQSSPNGNYYFHQHTIQFDGIKPVGGELITQPEKAPSPADIVRALENKEGEVVKEENGKPELSEAEKLRRELEEEGFITNDLSVHYDLSDTNVGNIAAQPSQLLLPGIDAFVQEDAIGSISQLLLADEFDRKGLSDTLFSEPQSNKERTKAILKTQLDKYTGLAEKYKALIESGDPNGLRIQQAATNLQKVYDQFDALHRMAQERLDKIGLRFDGQGYYQSLDNADDFRLYDDDSEYTTNHYDALSKLVRQFISFNARKVEKDGKVGNQMNSLGLASVVKPQEMYTKIINWVSEHYFEPTYEGFLDMAGFLQECPDPTVQDIATRLLRSPNAQLKFQFFAATLKFKTDHIQQLITVGREGVFAKNIEANRAQMAKVVFDQLSKDFLSSSEVLLTTSDIYGNPIYRVDKTRMEPLLIKFVDIAGSKDAYRFRLDQDGRATGSRYLADTQAHLLYDILRQVGIGISFKGFTSAISAKTATNPTGDAYIGIKSLFTGGNKILRNMVELQGSVADRDLRNPFISNTTEMMQLSRAESQYRDITQTDSFRSNGKSYYPFTRMSFVKSLFLQLSDTALTGQLSPLLTTFTKDPFKSASRFIQQAKTDPTFSAELWFARGAKETGTKSTNEEVKDMNDKDFILSKLFAFQNSGNQYGLFYSDTYSDKTTRFQVKAKKQPVTISFDDRGPHIDETTLNTFYHYFLGELRRINWVRQHNESLPNEQRVAGFHDIVDAKGVIREGIGKYFVIFNFLNEEFLEPDMASLLYHPDGSVKTDPAAIAAIKRQIHQQLIDNINNYAHYLNDLGLFTDANGEFRATGINDSNYLKKMAPKLSNLGESKKSFYITADYLLNSSLNSLEMLTLTGDPAQSPKVNRSPSGKINVAKSIRDTLVEASKRNASLNAPFDQGINVRPSYKVGFVQDVKINSGQLAEYKRLLPSQAKAIEDGYKNGDMTDAQELTTVKEHLYNLLSLGRISPIEMIEGLSHFDREDFLESRQELAALLQSLGIQYTLNPEKLGEITAKKDMIGLLQVFKGVQRYSRWDDNLGMSVETYIKTSSFPLVPHLVEGKDFEDILQQMKASKIDRLNFSSGTKQGLINPQPIYLADGHINPNLFTNNVIELPASAWGEQGQNPEKEELQVTEGSQQQRLIFVDLPDEAALTYKEQPITGKELRAKYVADHRIIFQSKVDDLFKEMNIETIDETNYFATYKTLSNILQREGLDRDYDRNTLLSLGLNPEGMFEIPLTFLPNSSQIQSLIAAIISNRILKNKLPGTSLIQGSEVVIKTQGKLKVTEDITTNRDNIVWTKPEYRHLNKLAYIRTEGNEVKPAQIILPFYWKTAEGKSVPLSTFTNSEGLLDTSKIDPELLEINGFRIPYAGPNSGMWFEVVGYLPETMGSLVIVPAEVAAQMGADYDVDKLFTYVLNHKVHSGGIRVDTSTARKSAENDIIQAHKAVYLAKSRLGRVIEPTSTDELAGAVSRNLPKSSTELTQIFDPAHQDKVWLSNRAGQLGIGISANTNTFHAIAQQSNLFTTGYGVKFLDKQGKLYNEVDHPGDTINNPDTSIYNYQQGMDTISPLTPSAITRLDRIHTFPNPYTGETRPISSVINNWLQASVDNAKLQLLGAAGINKFNFNAALTIVLHGFDSDWVVPFINQPILKEYYATIQNVNDKFNRDYSTNRREKTVDNLISKYVEAAEIKDFDNVQYKPVSHEQLLENIGDDMKSLSKEQLATQLEILKQFLQMDQEGTAISRIAADSKVEVRGLSKSFSEINQQAKDISAMGSGLIGNAHRIISNTVSGIYLNVPAMVDRLFTNPDNPVFAYSTPTYQQIGGTIQELAGRALNNEQLDDVYKEFKQFVYTHPSLGLSHETTLEAVKQSLLFGDNAVVSLWRPLKDKYPNSILLNQLSPAFSQRANDPQVLTMQRSADDIATQVKQEWLDFFKSTDPALVTFINRLTTYSLVLSSKEYGPSNLLNYIPFEVLKGIAFGERLNSINQSLSKPELFNNFYRQYFQHNPGMAKFILSSNLPKNTLYQQFEGKATNIPATFTLPIPTVENLKKHPPYAALASRQDKDTFTYRRFVRTFINDQVGFTLYELQKDGQIYNRIDTLGNQYISEYNLSNPNIQSAFPLQQSSQQSDSVAIPQPNNDITATYQEAGSQLDDVLSTIQLRNAQATDGVGRLFYELAKALSGKSSYQIEFTQATGTRGTTFHANERIEIHPTDIQKAADKLNIPFEQALQQTILHEAVHATADRFIHDQEQLPASQQDSRYTALQSAWNTYRRNLVESNKSTLVRGIPDSFLEAELFKVLYQRFADNRQGRSDHIADIQTVFRNWDEIKKSRQEMLSIIQDLQRSMIEAHNVHSIGQKANFELVIMNSKQELVPVDTERVAQIVDYLDKNFSQTSPSTLKDKYYAYVNVQEFMTMAMTSPGFMEHLNIIPSSKGAAKTIWSKLLDIIKSIVSSFNPSSLLSEAVDAIMNIATYRRTEEAISSSVEPVTADPNTAPETQLPQPQPQTEETPPWEEAPAPALPTAAPQIPTSDNLTSFTFSDGITIDTEGKVLNPQQRGGLQQIADLIEAIMTKKPVTKLFTLSGYAGTGKSSTIKFLVKYLNRKWRGRILFALSTPTHKANKVLRAFFRGTINDDPVTTKSILGYKAERDPETNRVEFVLDERKNKMPRDGIVVIDESSFIGQKEYGDLLAAAAQKNATLIFMGDIAQIPPPDGSNKVSPTFSIKNQYQLTQVMRQADGNPLSPIYDRVRNNLLIDGFQHLFPHKTNINSKGEGIEFIRGTYKETAKLLAPAIEAFQSDAFKTDKLYAKIIAYGNATVESYNQRIRQSILQDASEDFQLGELLMGYEQKGEEPIIQNGQDYIITDRQYVTGKSVPDAPFKVNGYQLKVREADQPEGSRTVEVFILNSKDLENQPFLQHYVNLLEQAKKVKGYEYFDILRKISRIEQTAIVPETVYSYQGKYYTNSMLRQQFPALFQYDEQTGQRAVDKMLSVAKNVDYGYAVTAHKVQGSTYKNVFIDENNLEFDKRIIAGPDGKPFSYERNNLLYVALSRPTTKAVVLSRHTIEEGNSHQASPQELAENRPVSQAMQPTGSVKNQAMSYKMDASENLTGKDTTTLALVESGQRTATTRSFSLGRIGDIITFEGKPQQYRVTAVEQLTAENVKDPQWIQKWSEKEQWTPEHFKKVLGNSTVHIGSYQTSFEKIGNEVPQTQNGPTLNTSDSTVDKIRKGTKTYLNAQNQLAEGTYYLKDGTRIQLIYQGEAAVTGNAVFIAPDVNDQEGWIEMPKDQYAKKEGYANWAEFEANAKNAAAFIKGEEPRYSYLIKTMGKNYDLTEEAGRKAAIDALKEKGLLKQDC